MESSIDIGISVLMKFTAPYNVLFEHFNSPDLFVIFDPIQYTPLEHELMKIALCFSGYLRSFEQTFASWQAHFLSHYNVDVFIDTWDTVSFNSNRKSPIDLLEQMYHPKQINIEPPRTFSKNIAIKHFRQATNGNINNPISMFYKIHSCNSLCKNFGGKYDLVFRARPDILLTDPFEIDKDSAYFVNVPIHHFHVDFENRDKETLLSKYIDHQADELQSDGLIKKQGILDHFAYSSPFNMDIYSDVYNHYETYYQEGCNVRPEITLSYHLLKNEIPIKGVKSNFFIRQLD